MTPVTYFRSYPEPFYSDWRSEPVPGWGVRPVMAGPRMVAVGGFGAAPPSTDLLAVVNDLAKLLAAEKNPPAAAVDPNGPWRKEVLSRITTTTAKYTIDDAKALANGLVVYVKNKYGVTLDLSSDLAEGIKRGRFVKAFQAGMAKAHQEAANKASAEAAAKAASEEAAAMTASIAGAKPVYKETWFLVAAGVAAMGVAYLLYTK